MQKIYGCRQHRKIFDIMLTQNLKKSSLSTLLHLQDHTEENVRIGGSGELLLSSSELKYFSTESFPIKA